MTKLIWCPNKCVEFTVKSAYLTEREAEIYEHGLVRVNGIYLGN